MRIVHVVDYLMPTMGYQEFLLPKWNARHGHEVHILTSERYAPVPNYAETFGTFLGPRICEEGTQEIEGVSVHRLATTWELEGRVWLSRLPQRLAALKPDAVFVHGTSCPTAFRVAPWCRKENIPLVLDNHMTFSSRRSGIPASIYYPVLRTFTRYLLAPAAYRFLGVAQECCDFLIEAQAAPAEKVVLLPLGIDTEIFAPDPQAAAQVRRESGIADDDLVVMQTGKITPDKGAALLADAMAPLMAAEPRLHLVLLGGGPADYLQAVEAPLRRQDVVDRLHILPFVGIDRLPGMFGAADICVYAGAASLSCIEAAACGRPVLMTDLPIGRWRADRGVGEVFADGDAEDLRRRIGDLLASDSRRQALGAAARRSVMENFSYDAVGRLSEEILEEAIARKR